MAFLWKHPKSQYWIARFYDRNGKRRNRSTRCKNRKKAQKLADVFEEAANRKRTAAQARRVIAALHAEITGEGLPVQTLRQFFHQWNESKRAETVPSTAGTSKGWFDGVHVSVAAGLSKSVLGLRPGMPSSSQRVQVYRLPEDDLNSVRDCFGRQLAEMIEKLTVRPKDFVYLDRLIKTFWA